MFIATNARCLQSFYVFFLFMLTFNRDIYKDNDAWCLKNIELTISLLDKIPKLYWYFNRSISVRLFLSLIFTMTTMCSSTFSRIDREFFLFMEHNILHIKFKQHVYVFIKDIGTKKYYFENNCSLSVCLEQDL